MFRNKKTFIDILNSFDEMFNQFESTHKKYVDDWISESRVSEDGTIKVTTYYKDGDSLKLTGEIKSLKSKLESAIENEDFESAVEIRDQIKVLETNQEVINKLELDLKKSIQSQDFEKSIDIRDQIKNLKK